MTYDTEMLRAILERAFETVQTAYVQPPEPEESEWAQDTAQNAQGEHVEWWDAEAIAWDGHYSLRREFGSDDVLHPNLVRLNNVLYRASIALYDEPRIDGSQNDAASIYAYAIEHLAELLAEQDREGWKPPQYDQNLHHHQQVLETRPEVLTLSAVRSVLGNDTLALLANQGGPTALETPLRELLPRLDVQTLAILIRDMEDAPNTRGEIHEQIMLAVIKASRTAGELRVGRQMFDALISEYE